VLQSQEKCQSYRRDIQSELAVCKVQAVTSCLQPSHIIELENYKQWASVLSAVHCVIVYYAFERINGLLKLVFIYYSFLLQHYRPMILILHYLYRVMKKKPSRLRNMITYIKTKKKSPPLTHVLKCSIFRIPLSMFFTRAIISYEPLNV
jgi:hypothetical protein